MKKIGIFLNPDRDPGLKAAAHAAAELISRGASVFFDLSYKTELSHTGAEFVSHSHMLEKSDLIVALGGDGTILKIIKAAAGFDTPVIGINLGHLGFLTQAEKGDDSIFDKIVCGDYTVNHFMMLECRIYKNGVPSEPSLALNDIILRGNNAKMISLEVEIDKTVANRYLADGIIAATAIGSTAYSLSCGGPIVHQALDCILLTPVCPHTLKSRCIAVPPASKIILRFDASYCSETDLKADGEAIGQLSDGDYIEIAASKLRAPLAMINDRNYFDVIRKKLSD